MAILQQEWGAPLGPGKQSDSSPGVYRREFEKATITLDLHHLDVYVRTKVECRGAAVMTCFRGSSGCGGL